jgi:hypothetical protein
VLDVVLLSLLGQIYSAATAICTINPIRFPV